MHIDFELAFLKDFNLSGFDDVHIENFIDKKKIFPNWNGNFLKHEIICTSKDIKNVKNEFL